MDYPETVVMGSGQHAIDLTIVVPCLNEEENVADILDQIRDLAAPQSFKSEIVIVDDQSDDNTQAIVQKWVDANKNIIPARLVVREIHRRGYGAVVRYGAAHGLGRYCIFVSADAVDPISLIPNLYEEMENGAVLAGCSRYLAAEDSLTIPLKYKFSQFFFRIGVRIALGQYIPDSTYAFKMFRRRESLGIGLTQNRFSVSPEITFKSILSGGKITYIPGAQGVRARGVSGNLSFTKKVSASVIAYYGRFFTVTKIAFWF